METFFKRLLQLIDCKGFKNINDFALNGLKYESSSKLARLKDGSKKPSVEIIEDIANKFEDLELRWLLLGKGEMLKEFNKVNEPRSIYQSEQKDSKLLETLLNQVKSLEKDKEELRNDKKYLQDIIDHKLGKQNAS